MKKIILLSLLFSGLSAAAQFGAGNLVIYRVGDGVTSLANTGNAVFLDEYTPAGALVQSIALPTTISGSNKQLVASGTASSEGLLTRSSNGQFLVLCGYASNIPAAASLTSSASATVNRTIGLVDNSGNINTTTALSDASTGSNPRSAVSTNGIDLWIDGGAGGIRYTTVGATTSTQLSATPTNLRHANIFGGQLYVSSGSGTTRVATVGTGIPTTTGQTITNLPGAVSSLTSPYGFILVDLDAGVAGDDVLYVADDAAGALTKYSLVGGTWVSNGVIGVDADDYRGLTGTVSGTTVTLYATRKGGTGSTGGGEFVSLSDASGYNGSFSGTPILLATASTNTAFRGIAFTPQSSTTPSLSISSPLTAFGNVCLNTEAGPNSFTISGSNLTTANVDVAALAGYTYSTTAGGTYTSTLSIPQSGGTFSQQVFVKFSPTVVQSYNGNIVVSGGGAASSVNAAASGAGVNTIPSVTTGTLATSITQTTATAPGSISANGCSSVTAYGIEYSTTSGFVNGTGTQVASSNLSGGNFSSNLTGLTANTPYYYKAYATNSGGTAYGTEQTFTTLAVPVPALNATALAAFGNVCINTTAGPNSFTITGTDLTSADVTVAALAGFTYSTTSGGTYTSTLAITQPGGTFSQEVFVKFDPTVVQSYNGNIVIAGGGAPLVNVAASGAGINTLPSVTTGSASSITTTSATAAGSISVNGCTTVTVYGIEYSTTSGFVNGTGTQVASSNLSGGNFTSGLTGLTPNTPYYYKAYATNAGGTAYGAEQTFTTLALVPTLNATTLADFGSICINTTAGPNSFTITGTDLTTADVTVAALAGFTYSTTSGGTYTSTLAITLPGGTFSQDVFVKFDPTVVQSYSGNIAVAGGGAPSVNVAASGAGINTLPSVTTGAASSITTSSATAAGSISANGCTAVTAYGIEYSLTSGFVNGTGTQVASSNLSAGNFSSDLTGLASGTPYYYKAYATNGGGTAYGSEQTFVTLASTPTLNATSLMSFGDICLNTEAGPNSFTINGSALSAGNITVGPLAGYTFSTTSGGTYTASLAISQPGGTFAQDVFVKFTPVVVQSYNGNIPVAGGGASAINVAVTGAGINTAPSVTTGAASGITAVAATTAGSIPGTGCSTVTVYGIEYSTTNGFANGSGTQVASSNLSGGNFTSALTGLVPSTTYYYKAYATNAGGTTWGVQQSFVTATPGITATTLTAFGSVCLNTTAGPNSFTINGTNLTSANITVGPLAGYTFSTTSGGTYTASLAISQPGGTFAQDVFVIFTPTAVQSYNGNIPVAGGGAASIDVAASGAGINTAPAVTTGGASAITSISATAAGSITATGCSAITVYGIEYSTTNGFANGSGTQVASSNLSGGNYSSVLTGLVPSTTYYYKAYATNAGGTTWGVQQSFVTATPGITATALTAFGSVCLNTTAGPNSFTISGTNLTAANVTVGPLAGYTFSTTSGGTYTASLTLTQPGGSYSQQVFVRFTPIAVQSYNGNIAVNGGGIATAVNAAASGAGINTMATVSTGSASAITYNGATAAGSITATGCTSVTAYGIEYSTTNGFVNGTGTQVTSANLSGGNFTSALTGLAASTVYYYKAYATNAGGTSYGAQQTFTTAPVPISLTATALNPFGTACINTTSAPNTFTINGAFLTTANINVGPLAGYTFSSTSGGTYTATLSLTQPGGTYSQAVYVRFTPTAVQDYIGNIPVAGGGFGTTVNVAASGTGVNTMATVITGTSSNLNNHSGTLAGSIPATGCSNVTAYGIEYSGINGFANGTGIKVAASNLNSGNFSVNLDGLVQGATYYYKAYATNAGGTSYGLQQSFTVPAINQGFNLYPAPAQKGTEVRLTKDKVKPGYYGLLLFNSNGQLVFQKDMNIQANFINQAFTIPATLTPGVYTVLLVHDEDLVATRMINIF